MPQDYRPIGRVTLAGAGPGDPELLTLKSARALARADVVLYDALVNVEILEEHCPHAERILVGKRAKGLQVHQDTTHALMVAHARMGKHVVRLKGGDPFVFGRGSEEALFCKEHHVPFEIIAGISSSIAAGVCSQIPVTHRGVSTHFTVVTGSAAKSDAALFTKIEHLARAGGTLVFLMPMGNIERIQDTLLDAGLNKETPAALVHNASLSTQSTHFTTLKALARTAALQQHKTPTVLIVGDVVHVGQALNACASSTNLKELAHVSL